MLGLPFSSEESLFKLSLTPDFDFELSRSVSVLKDDFFEDLAVLDFITAQLKLKSSLDLFNFILIVEPSGFLSSNKASASGSSIYR